MAESENQLEGIVAWPSQTTNWRVSWCGRFGQSIGGYRGVAELDDRLEKWR